MSNYQIPLASDNTIAKKLVSFNVSSNAFLSLSPASTASSFELTSAQSSNATFSNVKIGGQTVSFSSSSIGYITSATPGSVSASKAIILDSNKDCSNIDTLGCNTMTVNGTDVPTSLDNVDAVPAIDYFTNITPGTATADSLVVTDSNNSVSIKETKSLTMRSPSVEIKGIPPILHFDASSTLSIGDWRDCCWSVDLNKLAVVGYQKAGTISVSNTTPTVLESDCSINLKKVIWCSWLGTFIAVADTGLYKSGSGNGYIVITSASTETLRTINANNTVCIIVGTDKILTTVNGISFNSYTVVGDWMDIAFSNTGVVIVGTNKIAYAYLSDLTVWTTVDKTGTWCGVAKGNNDFIAISSAVTNASKILSSPDMINWYSMDESWITNTYSDSLALRDIIWVPIFEIYVASVYNCGARSCSMYYSKDGINWQYYNDASMNIKFALTWCPSKLSIVGLSGGYYDTAETYGGLLSSFCCPRQISGAGSGLQSVLTSVKSIDATGMIYGLGGKMFTYSDDGYTFKRCTINGVELSVARYVYGVAYSPTLSLYVAVGDYTAGSISNTQVSTDGKSWSYITNATTDLLYSIEWDPLLTMFISVPQTGNYMLTSTDGTNWTKTTFSGFSPNNHTVVYYADMALTLISGVSNSQTACVIKKVNDVMQTTNVNYGVTVIHSTYAFGKLYLLNSSKIYTTNDFITFTPDISVSNSVSLVFMKELNLLIHTRYFGGNSYVDVYNGSTWSYNIQISNNLAYMYFGKATWSAYYKCMYAPNYTSSIVRNRSIYTRLIQSTPYNTESVIKNIPSIDTYKGQLDDRIMCAFADKCVSTTSVSTIIKVRYSRSSGYVNYHGGATFNSYYSTNGGYSMTVGSGSFYNSMKDSIDVDGVLYVARLSNILYQTATIAATTALAQLSSYDGSYIDRLKYSPFLEFFIAIAGTKLYVDPVSNKYIQLPGAPTSLDCRDNLVVCCASGAMYIYDCITKTLQTVSLTGSWTDICYSPEIDIFISVGGNKTAYSYNGIDWTTTVDTVAWTEALYVPELEMFAACATNTFGYSLDGIVWRKITTPVTNTWTSLTYNAYHGTFVLLSTSAPKIFISGPIIANASRVMTSLNSYIEDDKLTLRSSDKHHKYAPLTHTLDTDSSIILRSSTLGSNITVLSQSNGITNFNNSSSNLVLPLANGADKGLSINDTLITSTSSELYNASLFNSTLRRIPNRPKSGYLMVDNNKTLKVDNVNASALQLLPADADSGLVVADSNGTITIPICKTNQIQVGNTTIKHTPAVDNSLLTFTELNSINSSTYQPYDGYVMAYSSDLNMILRVINSTPVVSQYSYDYGKTWGISNASIIATNLQQISYAVYRQVKLLWFSTYKCFVLAGLSIAYISYDGINWLTTPSLATASDNVSSICMDSSGKPIFVGTLGFARPNSATDLTQSWTTNTTANVKVQTLIWSTYFNTYVGTNGNNIYYSADLITWTVIANSTFNGTATGFGITDTPNGLYFGNYNGIYKKTNLTLNSGTLITAHGITSTSVFSMVYIPITNSIFTVVQSAAISKCIYIYNDGASINTIPIPIMSIDRFSNTFVATGTHCLWIGNAIMLDLFARIPKTFISNVLAKSTVKNTRSIQWLSTMQNSKMESDRLGSFLLNYIGGDRPIYSKYSTISYNTKAAAWKDDGNVMYVGTNVIFTARRIHYKPTNLTYNGNWIDCLWDGSRWVILSDANIGYSTDAATWTTYAFTGGKNIVFSQGLYIVSTSTGVQIASDITANSWSAIMLTGSWNCVKYVGKYWVLVGTNTIAYTSTPSVQNSWVLTSCKGEWLDIAYGKGMYIACGVWCTCKTYDFSKYVCRSVAKTYNSITYARPFNRFYISSIDMHSIGNNIITCSNTAIMSSADGNQWVKNSTFSSDRLGVSTLTTMFTINRIYWLDDTSQFVMPMAVINGATRYAYLLYTPYLEASNENTLITTPTTMRTNTGLTEIANAALTTGPKTFNVMVDSAAKPGTSTWTTSSDERLKEDIVLADTQQCYDLVKNLPLKYYKWKDDFAADTQTTDMHRLGWIAQDVEKVIPKAVSQSNYRGLEDCRDLNTDQIIANLYGAIQKLLKDIEEKEEKIKNI